MPSSNLVSECRNSIDILLMTCNGIDLYYRSSFVVFFTKMRYLILEVIPQLCY